MRLAAKHHEQEWQQRLAVFALVDCSSRLAGRALSSLPIDLAWMEFVMQRHFHMAIGALAIAMVLSPTLASGQAARGQQLFNNCAACHSLEPDKNMTGPSLAGLWNRKAGSLTSFSRYSEALKSSNVVWNDKTLDEWIKDPLHLIPGNDMPFQGMKNDKQRADLLAFLKAATQPGHAPSQSAQGGQMGGGVSNLKKLDPEEQVQKITYCGDTYRVTTANGKTRNFWERNLRLKTDSSADGPRNGIPALLPAGMVGDRADVIFAAPEEISGFIMPEC
jgi:cytochrome c